MSLVPSFIGWEHPRRVWDQHFGMDLHPTDLDNLFPRSLIHHNYYRPWRHSHRNEKSSAVTLSKDKFQACLDVQQFTPEEITVKIVDDAVTVEGKHEEKQDEHGYISRQFVRRYVVPKQYDIGQLTSSLSSDGVLTLDAPKAVKALETERVVPIIKTGPVHAVLEKAAGGEKKGHEMET